MYRRCAIFLFMVPALPLAALTWNSPPFFMQPDLSVTDDIQLFHLIAGGDERAFRIFFDKYRSKVYRYLVYLLGRPAEAEECLQDIFLRLWTSRQRLADVTHPEQYLSSMVRNRAYTALESIGRRAALQQQLQQQQQDSSTTEETVYYNECKRLISEAVSRLSPQRQSIYRMAKEQGLSRKEIAEALNISEHTVKNALGIAVQDIRAYLEEKGMLP